MALGVPLSTADIFLEVRDELLHNQVPLKVRCAHLLFGEWGFLVTKGSETEAVRQRQWDRGGETEAVGPRQRDRGSETKAHSTSTCFSASALVMAALEYARPSGPLIGSSKRVKVSGQHKWSGGSMSTCRCL